MNAIDYIVLIVLSIGLIKGFIKGAVGEIFGLLAIILGLICSYLFHPYTNRLILYVAPDQELIWLSVFLTFIAVYFTVILIGKLITKTLKIMALGPVNRIFGGIIGASKMTILILFAYTISMLIFDSISKPIPQLLSDSQTYILLQEINPLELIQNRLDSW